MDHFVKDPFKVNAAILPGVQNYWGEGKMYSKCMEKVGRFSSIIWGTLAFYNFYELQSKDTQQKMLPIKWEGFMLAEKWEILFLVFHTNASKFFRQWQIGFTDKYWYMEKWS